MYDVTCFGYEYDDLRQECSLSNVRIHGEGLACKSCHFYEKACQSGRHFIILTQVLAGMCTSCIRTLSITNKMKTDIHLI